LSDKENAEKENEQFSSSILYVATAVYVSVCAMVFGALYAKLPTFGEAFLLLTKDYGTILAGIPVLVAVVVAKQQLDAMRRQHIANVKRSLKAEIDALANIRGYAMETINSTFEIAKLQGSAINSRSIYVSIIPPSSVKRYKEILNEKTVAHIELMNTNLNMAIEISDAQANSAKDYLSKGQVEARLLLIAVDEEMDHLSQYWS